jgi:hypothetical protein
MMLVTLQLQNYWQQQTWEDSCPVYQFVNDLEYCEQHKYSPFLVNLALSESNSP